MARDMVAVMERLGFPHFSVAGHDRGGRVAYRLALDHPARVDRIAVLDVLPTTEVWERADSRFALAFWPWSLLAQPEPFPERLLAAAPEAIVDNALGGWGSPPAAFGPGVRAAYVEALRDPVRVHAICEEYRAAATCDREHDEADRRIGRRIACPVLAVWSRPGSTELLVQGDRRTAGALAGLGGRCPGPSARSRSLFPGGDPGRNSECPEPFLCRDFLNRGI
jgi:haloacetate dehalogenase